MKARIRYNSEFLKQYCKENEIILLTQEYSGTKINRETIIRAICIAEGCTNTCSKTFRSITHIGCYCKQHTKENRTEKFKHTSLEKYGVENPCQSKEVKNKIKATNIDKYGFENPFQSEKVKQKIKATNIERYGVEYSSQNNEVRDKVKATNMERYGVENPNQNREVREKIKATNMERYGVEYSSQNNEVRYKINATNMEKYGVENVFQSEEVKDKIKATNVERYGVENPNQNREVREKTKATNLERYGVENVLQSEKVKDQIKVTNMERYGVEYPLQNAGVSERASKNSYKSRDYIFPSERIETIQGYEHFMLNHLLEKEKVLEDDILVNRSDMPIVWYEDAEGVSHRYFVDCFIKSQNRCIEAKSTWTAEKKKENIYLKQNALKNAGYICEIWIYNNKGELVDKKL